MAAELSNRSGSIGLVLSGGGGKGAYEIGCWRALREAGIEVEAVAGTSVGALNAALVAQGDFESAEELWSRITAKEVFSLNRGRLPALLLRLLLLPGLFYFRSSTASKRKLDLHFLAAALFTLLVVGVPAIAISLASGYKSWSDLRPLAIYYGILVLVVGLPVLGWFWLERRNLFVLDNRPLEETITKYLNPDAVRDSAIDAYVTAARGVEFFDPEDPSFEAAEAGGTYYNFPCLSREYLPVYSKLNGRDPEDITQLLLRSTSLPFGIFPNRELSDAGWMDGGLADNTPVLPLVERGCDPIVVVHLDHRVGRSRSPVRIDANVGVAIGALERKLEVEGDSQRSLREFIDRYGSMVELTKWPETRKEPPLPSRPLPTLLHIVPSRRLGRLLRGTLRFSPRRSRWLMRLGYADTKKALAGQAFAPLSPGRAIAHRLGRSVAYAVAAAACLAGLAALAALVAGSGQAQEKTEIPLLFGIGTSMIVLGSALIWYAMLRSSASFVPAATGMIAWLGGLLVAIHGMEGVTPALLVVDFLIGLAAAAISLVELRSFLGGGRRTH
jgi:predicted acylesterase/phospholipase RssA